jgi:hypothetical protein
MAILYVWNGHSGTNSGTKANPYNTSTGIQTALNAASAGDVILVHKGDSPYKPNIAFADDGSNNHIKLLRWKPNSGRPVIDGSLTAGDTYGFKVTNINGTVGTPGVYTIVGFEIKNIRGDGPGNSFGVIYSTSACCAHLAHLYMHDCDKGFRGGVGGSGRYSTVVSCVMKDIQAQYHGVGFRTEGNVKLHNCIAIRCAVAGFANNGANNTYNEYRHCMAADCGIDTTVNDRVAMDLNGNGSSFVFNCVVTNSGSNAKLDYAIRGAGGIISHFNNFVYSDKGWSQTAIGNGTTSIANKTENIITGSSIPPEPIKFIARFVTGTLSASLRENFRVRSGSVLINSGSALPECLLDFDMIPRGHRNPGSGSIIFPGGPRIGRGPASLFDDKPLHSTYITEEGITPQYSGMWASSSFAIRFGARDGTSPPLYQPSWSSGGGNDGDYIDITRTVGGIKNSSWSFFCWILGESAGASSGDHRTILTVHSSGSATAENYLDDRLIFFIESGNDGTYANMLRIQAHPGRVHGKPTNEVWDTTGAHTWRHVGLTFNLTGSVTGSTTNPHIKLYLDGVLETTIDNPNTDITLEVSGSDYMMLGVLSDIQDVSGNGYHGGSNNMQSGTFGYLFNDDGLTGSLYHYRTYLLGGVVPNSNFRLVDVGPFEYNHELPLFQGKRHVSQINGVRFVNGDGGEDYHRSIGKFMGVEMRPSRRFEAAGRLYVLSTGSHQSFDMDAGH